MADEQMCGHCGFPLHPSDTLRYFGFYVSHQEERCRWLLKNEIATLRAKIERQDAALERLSERAEAAESAVDVLEKRLAAERERCADLRPSRDAGHPPGGKWGGDYQWGWDNAVIAYSDAIRALPAPEAT